MTDQSTSADRPSPRSHATQETQGVAAHLNEIFHVIAVMSGKGGVGKSFVTSVIAAELARKHFRVGILDADITGPSIPKMFGLTERPMSGPVGLAPVHTRTGIRVMSINLLLENADDAVIWRGPLIARAITQFWGDVFWQTLDYMLVDLPPGTADAPLTVMQSLPVDGIVLVTSPQELAGMVVRKAANMANHLSVPVIGVVENMSYATCPRCGEAFEVFGPSHLAEICDPLRIPVLARIPLDPQMSALCDAGKVEACASPVFEALVASLTERIRDGMSRKHHGLEGDESGNLQA